MPQLQSAYSTETALLKMLSDITHCQERVGDSTEKVNFYYCEFAATYFLNLRTLRAGSVQVQLTRYIVCEKFFYYMLNLMTSTGG